MVVTNRGRELGMRLRHVIDDLAQNVKEKCAGPAGRNHHQQTGSCPQRSAPIERMIQMDDDSLFFHVVVMVAVGVIAVALWLLYQV